MNRTSAEPVELSLEYITQCRTSDLLKNRNSEEVRSPREEAERNRKIDAELKRIMEEKRWRQEWFRTAESGAVQRSTADPSRRNDNALQAKTPTSDKTETRFSK